MDPDLGRVRVSPELMVALLTIFMKNFILALLIPVMLLAQPMVPGLFVTKTQGPPKPWTQEGTWGINPYQPTNFILFFVMSNQLGSVTSSHPGYTTNFKATMTLGLNRASCYASNPVQGLYSAACTTNWIIEINRYQKAGALKSDSVSGPWSDIEITTFTNETDIKFLKTWITNWSEITGKYQ